MGRHVTKRNLVWALILCTSIATAAAIVFWRPLLSSWRLLLEIGLLYFTIREFLYDKFPGFFRTMAMIRAIFWSGDVDLALAARFEDVPQEDFDQAVKRFLALHRDVKILDRDSHHVVGQADGFVFNIIYDANTRDGGTLMLTIPHYHTTYDGALTWVQNAFVPVMEDLEHIAGNPEATRYDLDLRFSRQNPFVGLYARKVSMSQIRKFEVEIAVPENKNRTGRIVILKNALSCHTHSVHSLVQLARQEIPVVTASAD